jgi:hypothetical protein
MSAVLLAMFDQHEIAERVRVDLVRDGFPTDRTELTASCEPGRAGLEPADSLHDRFVQYFRVLFTFDDEQHHAEQLANCLDNGAATITLHPRGSVETARAKQILLNARAVKLISHDLPSQTTESAAARVMRRWTIGAAACLGVVFCSSYDTGRNQLPTTDDLKASQQRWRDLTDFVLRAAPISTGL